MSKRFAALVVSLAVLVLVPSATAKDLNGVVVKVDAPASLLAVARENGDVELVRTAAAAKAHVGQRVQIDARRVRADVFVPERIRLLGDARRARLRATVHAASAGTLTLDAGTVLLSVSFGLHKTPPLGARVDLDVGFAGGMLVIARVNEVEIEQEEVDDDDAGAVDREHEDNDDGDDDNRGPGGGGDDGGGGHGRG